MTKRNVLILALILVVATLCLDATPAAAGTDIKHRPTGFEVTDRAPRVPHPPPPQGVWVPIVVQGNDPGYSDACRMEGKWGNFQPGTQGFVQYRFASGSNCSWGGTSMYTLSNGHARRTPTDDTAFFCVADTSPYQAGPYCVQLADGSLLIGAGNNRPIISSTIVTCWGQWSNGILYRRCDTDTWQINF